jgi:hypothetical protein
MADLKKQTGRVMAAAITDEDCRNDAAAAFHICMAVGRAFLRAKASSK